MRVRCQQPLGSQLGACGKQSVRTLERSGDWRERLARCEPGNHALTARAVGAAPIARVYTPNSPRTRSAK